MKDWPRWKLLAVGSSVCMALCASIISSMLYYSLPDLSPLKDPRQPSTILDINGKFMGEYCTYCRKPIPLDEMGNFPLLAVQIEDKTYWRRWLPFEPTAIGRAALQNFMSGSTRQGGSGIQQQLAKKLLPEVLAQEEAARKTGDQSAYKKLKWKRKIYELWVATSLRMHLDKKTLLELYLNNGYCGNGRYGVQSCSELYYEKDAQNLGLEQAAMIVGLLRSPSSNPFENPEKAKALRARVLEQLAQQRVINQAEQKKFLQIALPQEKVVDPCHAGHFMAYVRSQIVSSGRLIDQGLTIHTTLDCDLNNVAYENQLNTLYELIGRNPATAEDLRGALIVYNPHNGDITAWVQYPSFREDQYRLDQIGKAGPGLLPGSAFKVFFAAKWFEKGGRADCRDEGSGPCLLDDSAYGPKGASQLLISMGRDRPPKYIHNFDYEGMERYAGLINLSRAIGESRNAAIESGVEGVRGSRAHRFTVEREFERVAKNDQGIPEVITEKKWVHERIYKEELLELAMRLGISLPTSQDGKDVVNSRRARELDLPPGLHDPGLTVAIGSLEVSPFEYARAWSAFLTGTLVNFRAIAEIQEQDGRQYELVSRSWTQKTIWKDPKDTLMPLKMIRILRAPVEFTHGTAKAFVREQFQFIAKTGTAANSEGFATGNWFAGCSSAPNLCGASIVWRKTGLPLELAPPLIDPENPSKGRAKVKYEKETGGRNALPPLYQTFRAYFASLPPSSFPEYTDPKRPYRPSEWLKRETEKSKELENLKDSFANDTQENND